MLLVLVLTIAIAVLGIPMLAGWIALLTIDTRTPQQRRDDANTLDRRWRA